MCMRMFNVKFHVILELFRLHAVECVSTVQKLEKKTLENTMTGGKNNTSQNRSEQRSPFFITEYELGTDTVDPSKVRPRRGTPDFTI